MPIRLRCPTCQEMLHFGDDVATDAIRCPQCEIAVVTGGTRVADADSLGGDRREVRCPRCRLPMRGVAGTVVDCQGCGEAVRVPPATKLGDLTHIDGEVLAPPALGSTGTTLDADAPAVYLDPVRFLDSEPLVDFPSGHRREQGAMEFGRDGIDSATRAEPLPSGRARWFYVMPGTIFLLFSLFVILLVLGRVLFPFLLLVRSEFRVAAADGSNLVWAGLQTGLGTLLGGALAAVYLLGGVALIRRRGLTMARCAAIAACIPCLNALVLTPIGIWACFVAFGHDARRDFDA